MSTNPNDFNDTHPELLEGEVWLTNIGCANSLCLDCLVQWAGVPHSTKRLGDKGFWLDGAPDEFRSPVFVARAEYERLKAKGGAVGFNANHPEASDAPDEEEVFLGNIISGDGVDDPDWERINDGWMSPRPGDVAYAADGQVIPGHRPVFVLKWEYDRAQRRHQ